MTQPDDVTPMQVALQLHRAYAVATQRLNSALHPLGLSYRHAAAMFLIRDGARTHGRLVRELHVDKTSMVRTLDDLERMGIISKTRSNEDRRSWLLSLTDHGHAMIAQTQQRTGAVAEALFGAIDTATLASLHDALARVPGTEEPAGAEEPSAEGASTEGASTEDAGTDLARTSDDPRDA